MTSGLNGQTAVEAIVSCILLVGMLWKQFGGEDNEKLKFFGGNGGISVTGLGVKKRNFLLSSSCFPSCHEQLGAMKAGILHTL